LHWCEPNQNFFVAQHADSSCFPPIPEQSPKLQTLMLVEGCNGNFDGNYFGLLDANSIALFL